MYALVLCASKVSLALFFTKVPGFSQALLSCVCAYASTFVLVKQVLWRLNSRKLSFALALMTSVNKVTFNPNLKSIDLSLDPSSIAFGSSGAHCISKLPAKLFGVQECFFDVTRMPGVHVAHQFLCLL